MDRRALENVLDQVGHCGIWCGSCVVGTGALMALADRFRDVVESHGLVDWGVEGFDYPEFLKGLESIGRLPVCPGCLKGGGRGDCEMRRCVSERGVRDCVACGARVECAHREALEHMRTGARNAGLLVADTPEDRDRLPERGESGLAATWWRTVFEERT